MLSYRRKLFSETGLPVWLIPGNWVSSKEPLTLLPLHLPTYFFQSPYLLVQAPQLTGS